ncbi:MAG: 16S rRNA processing protein RimM [Lachnospiraceae bacterium]|nr:16S rRNA processing protein RimM [Lachnospiraceae bacterium]
MEDLLRVGVISSVHGIRGEVKVFPTTDDIGRFEELKEVMLDTGKGLIPLTVEGVKFFKQFAILKIKGYDTIESIERYKGRDLLVTRENAVELAEGEFFICDILGFSVVSTEGEELGILDDVMETGANDVFVVKKPDGKELLLPYIDECIREISLKEKKITAYLMPGLE